MDFLIPLIILTGATWRISSLLVDEDGPFDIFARLRYWVGVFYDENSQAYGTNELAKAFICVWCMSVWIGIGLTIGYLYIPVYTTWACLPLALSAGAIWLEKHT